MGVFGVQVFSGVPMPRWAIFLNQGNAQFRKRGSQDIHEIAIRRQHGIVPFDRLCGYPEVIFIYLEQLARDSVSPSFHPPRNATVQVQLMLRKAGLYVRECCRRVAVDVRQGMFLRPFNAGFDVSERAANGSRQCEAETKLGNRDRRDQLNGLRIEICYGQPNGLMIWALVIVED